MHSDGTIAAGGRKPLIPYQVLPRAARQAVHPARQPDDTPADADERTRIIVTAHQRLVITYSARDDTVYLLCPPGEDPRTVLGAARLVTHDDSYQELSWYLGRAPGPRRAREATELGTDR